MIKYNLILLFCIRTCYIAKQTNDCSLDRSSMKEAEEKRQMYMYYVINQIIYMKWL